jgi:hypothetical protein
MNPRLLTQNLPQFPVFFVEDLGEKGDTLKNPRKIVEEATAVAVVKFLHR